jgi:AcrR family transcriptional regulator
MTDQSVIYLTAKATMSNASATAPVSPSRARKRKVRGRAEKSAARRAAIIAAALDEFSARGFAATRIDDVARRAGVAKGTIYLYFRDKEALFQEIVRTMLVPIVGVLEAPPPGDMPIRKLLEAFIDLFVREVYSTKRRAVLRLVMTEGPRFPKLAEIHYRNVVERAMAAMRALIERAIKRGELEHDALLRFPQLVVAPGIVAIIWSGLFDRFAPLDVTALMRAQLEILFGKEGAS